MRAGGKVTMLEYQLDPLDFEDVVERWIAIANQNVFIFKILKDQQDESLSFQWWGVLMKAVGAYLIFEVAVFKGGSRWLVSLRLRETESTKGNLSFSVFVSTLPSLCLTIRHSSLFLTLQYKCIINTELCCHGDHLLHPGVLKTDDHWE